MPLEDVYIRSDAVVARMIGGETLAIPVRGGIGDLASIYRFNEVGTQIWEALARPMTFEELISLIERDYEANWKTVCDDMALFLTEKSARANIGNSSRHQSVSRYPHGRKSFTPHAVAV